MFAFSALNSSQDKRLSMQFQADSFLKLRDEIVPVYFGTLDVPAIVSGEVTLEVDSECEGSNLEINYSAVAGLKVEVQSESTIYLIKEKVLQRKRWIMDLDPTKTGRVGPGAYRRTVGATIDHLWPSSFNHDVNGFRLCWIRYFFDVKFHTPPGKMGQRVIIEKSFDVWILNSLDPSPMPSLSSKPLSRNMKTKKSGFVISFSIPSDGKVEVGQVLPVTIQVPPFENSKFRGQAPILTECVFKTHDWQNEERSGLERVINMTLPSYPEMTPSAKTQWLDVSYVLELSLKIRAQDQKEKDAETLSVELPLDVVSPRRAVAPYGEQLPAYE